MTAEFRLAASNDTTARKTPAGPAARDTDNPDDGALLRDAGNLRANWQRVQAAFVDDPRQSVGDAAALVEHAAQALAGALRQRQTELRGMWDAGGTRAGGNGGQAADGSTDTTEQLRLVLRQYRALFNQICRP